MYVFVRSLDDNRIRHLENDYLSQLSPFQLRDNLQNVDGITIRSIYSQLCFFSHKILRRRNFYEYPKKKKERKKRSDDPMINNQKSSERMEERKSVNDPSPPHFL